MGKGGGRAGGAAMKQATETFFFQLFCFFIKIEPQRVEKLFTSFPVEKKKVQP